jgi:TonB family protein
MLRLLRHGPKADRVAPLVLRFPQPLAITGAYLSEISGPSGASCGLSNIVAPTPAALAKPDIRLLTRAERVPRIAATQPVTLPAVSCDVPYAEARMARGAHVSLPASVQANEESRTVVVRVALARSGAVTDARVLDSSGFNDLDGLATRVARASRFRAQVFRCTEVAGNYRFVVSKSP